LNLPCSLYSFYFTSPRLPYHSVIWL
jgi:hypothetical protein